MSTAPKQTNAEGLRLFVEADGVPQDWPRRLKRACERGRWFLAVRLEADHMNRHVAWALAGFPGAGRRMSLADLREKLAEHRREPSQLPF